MDTISLFKIHEEQLKNNKNNDHHTEKLVQALGGIDAILTNYSKYNIILNETTINEINKIITIPSKTVIKKSNTANKESNDPVTLYLQRDNNYLSRFISAKRHDKIKKFIKSQITQICIIISWIIWFVVVGLGYDIIYSTYIILVALILWMPYCIFWLLSVNKQAFRYVIKGFDFRIKFVYMLIWGVLEMVHRFILQDNQFQSAILAFFGYLFFNTTCILGLIAISVFDGFEGKNNFKIIISATVASIALLYSVYYQFDRLNGDDSVVDIGGYQVSLRRFMANAQRVIGIFLAKQCYAMWRYKGVKAASIHVKPKLCWINITTNHHTNTTARQKSAATSKLAGITFMLEPPEVGDDGHMHDGHGGDDGHMHDDHDDNDDFEQQIQISKTTHADLTKNTVIN